MPTAKKEFVFYVYINLKRFQKRTVVVPASTAYAILFLQYFKQNDTQNLQLQRRPGRDAAHRFGKGAKRDLVTERYRDERDGDQPSVKEFRPDTRRRGEWTAFVTERAGELQDLVSSGRSDPAILDDTNEFPDAR